MTKKSRNSGCCLESGRRQSAIFATHVVTPYRHPGASSSGCDRGCGGIWLPLAHARLAAFTCPPFSVTGPRRFLLCKARRRCGRAVDRPSRSTPAASWRVASDRPFRCRQKRAPAIRMLWDQQSWDQQSCAFVVDAPPVRRISQLAKIRLISSATRTMTAKIREKTPCMAVRRDSTSS